MIVRQWKKHKIVVNLVCKISRVSMSMRTVRNQEDLVNNLKAVGTRVTKKTHYTVKDCNPAMPARSPLLKKAHEHEHLNDSEENWVKVLWSDELFGINSTHRVWRRRRR